jgi:hypothetical protein
MLCRWYRVTNILDKSVAYMMMEAVCSSEMLVTIYPPIRHCTLEYCSLNLYWTRDQLAYCVVQPNHYA